MITVAKDNSGDFSTIQSAIDSIAEGCPETVFIKNGTYKERVEIFKDNISLVGESKDKCIITEGYYANMIMEDGSKRGTFRSYTFLVAADNFKASNITFINSSGFGNVVGQAISVYAEGDHIVFSNCRILGHQDTLFTGPLPHKVRQPGGFTGPTEFAERRHVKQLYEDCYIEGEVDFIFGSATAYFKNCTLFALEKNEPEFNAFYTAPSTYEGQTYGYVFEKCDFTGNCRPGTAALGRPWRNYAKTVLLNCTLGEQVYEKGFDDWNKEDARNTVLFALYNCSGPGCHPDRLASFARQLSDEEALNYTMDKVLGKEF